MLKRVDDERRAGQSIDQKMAELRVKAPDIAELVDDERLTLEAGITELRARQRPIEEAIDAGKRAIARLQNLPVQVATIEKELAITGPDLLAGQLSGDAIAAARQLMTRIARTAVDSPMMATRPVPASPAVLCRCRRQAVPRSSTCQCRPPDAP
jgi:hypothetical protein